MTGGGGGGGGSVSSVFYAEKYHPIQAGSIDGTDVAPHDNAVVRALLCSSAGLYDPFGDPKATGDPYCTVFVGRLSRQTDDETLRKLSQMFCDCSSLLCPCYIGLVSSGFLLCFCAEQAMSRYGRVKSMRLVRDIVTGASRGYAFVEYETDREMRRAYEDAHHSIIDGSEVIVDYYRKKLMPGWIPRRLGGGLGGKKESGQLRFGGRERPFCAPLRPIPYDELKKLGISPPPVGQYMTRFQVPPPPRRESDNIDMEDSPLMRRSKDMSNSSHRRQRSSTGDDSSHHKRKSSHHRQEESERAVRSSASRETSSHIRQRSPAEYDYRRKRRSSEEPGELSPDREGSSYRSGMTSNDAGYSPHRSHQRRHHREHRDDSSSRSRHRDHRHHSDRAHSRSRRSEIRDYSH